MAFLYRIFLKGLLTLLPILLTIYLLLWAFNQAERTLASPIQRFAPELSNVPGAGVLIGILIIFAVGLLVNNYVTRRLVSWFERRLETLPVFRSIYSPIRDVTKLFSKEESAGRGQSVVMVQIGNGIEMMGLVTRDAFHDLPAGAIADSTVAVFLPFSYGVGGMTILVPRSSMRETQIPAERAMQLAVTGWIKSSK